MSVWLVLVLVAAVLVLASLASPTLRRIWVFNLYAWKHLLVWLADRLGLRWLFAKLTGRPYEHFTFPMLLRHFAEDMGPTYIKFGQIIASSTGVFPKAWSEEFQKCLDRVRPFGFDEVQHIIAAELGPEAQRLSQVDPAPLASASIAQVHKAVRDAGTATEEDVVIKVQRPGIATRVAADMRIMKFVARAAERFVPDAELVNPVGIVEDFSETLKEELDFRKEAKNLEQFLQIMGELEHKDVRAPRPHNDLTTPRILVMERFHGIRVDNVAAIHAREVNIEERLIKGMQAWFQCVLFYGFFHGDVHAGNLMLLDNNDVGFLDFGIVGRFNDQQRYMVTDYVVAFATADYKTLARVITEMGSVKGTTEQAGFAEDLEKAYSPLLKLSFQDINYAEILPRIQEVASRHRMKMPKEFVLITKQMLYFDRYAKLLAPKLNVFTDPRLVASLMADVMKARMQAQAARSSS
jgi:predicted unusual protein kinase regulating ubiquinone biosynthesis (AarF/ABC1/UbiB family)